MANKTCAMRDQISKYELFYSSEKYQIGIPGYSRPTSHDPRPNEDRLIFERTAHLLYFRRSDPRHAS